MREKLYIATGSVIAIALTLSLLNIFVFPNLYYRLDVYRNTENSDELSILAELENLNLESELFDSLNITNILIDTPEYAICPISFMINQVENRESGSFDSSISLYNETYVFEGQVKRIRMTYNGTIQGINLFESSESYQNWIEQYYQANNNASYFGYQNTTSLEYELYSSITDLGLASFTISEVLDILELIFTENRPTYVVYQTMDYFESRGFLQDFSTTFTRTTFITAQGSILFFITNEGYWQQPLSFF